MRPNCGSGNGQTANRRRNHQHAGPYPLPRGHDGHQDGQARFLPEAADPHPLPSRQADRGSLRIIPRSQGENTANAAIEKLSPAVYNLLAELSRMGAAVVSWSWLNEELSVAARTYRTVPSVYCRSNNWRSRWKRLAEHSRPKP